MSVARDAASLRQQLHILRNSLNVMVNAQHCLVSVSNSDPSHADLRGAFQRAAAEAAATIERIETILAPRETV